MRTEVCQCGGYIRAESVRTCRPAVMIHNLTLPHLAWRQRMGIFTPDFGASDDSRRRWPTADDDSCDVSGNTDGASASGVGSLS